MSSRSPAFGVRAQAHERAHVVAPRGELDLFSVEQLKTALAQRPELCDAVVLDLRDLTFLDCAGLGALRALAERVRDAGWTVACTCPDGEPRSLIELVGADFPETVRRPGKLPPETVSATYALEYGQNSLELHADAIGVGTRVVSRGLDPDEQRDASQPSVRKPKPERGLVPAADPDRVGRESAQAVVISRRVNDKVTGRRAARGVYGSYRYRHQAGPTAMALARTRWMQKLSGNQ